MKLKSFLLGSAAAFAVVGGAQAADLSVAEPVEFVRICELFGNGYWYLPGTDTCLKIGGKVDFQVNLHNNIADSGSTHSSNWDFLTEAGLNFTAKSMTDFGELVGYVALIGAYDGTFGSSASVTLDGAWLRIGALQAGHFGSPFNPATGFVDYQVYKSTLKDNNKIQLSWAAAGFGLALGIEDPRETWGTALPVSWSMPLVTGAITASQDMWSGKLSAGFVQLAAGTSWGVDGQITFNLDTIAAGDKFMLNGAYGDNAFVGGTAITNPATNNGWSAIASFQHMFSSTFSGAIDYTYLHTSGPSSVNSWAASGACRWPASRPSSVVHTRLRVRRQEPGRLRSSSRAPGSRLATITQK